MPSLKLLRFGSTASLLFLFIVFLGSCHKNNTGSSPETISPVPDESDSLSFLVLGDWGRSGSQLQRAVALSMDSACRRHNVQFIITSGDNFYENGVLSTQDPLWSASFEQVYTLPGLQVPWYAVLGNHDYNLNPQAQVAYTAQSNRWHMPARYYSVRNTIGASRNVLFLFTDTSPFVESYYNAGMSDLTQQDTAAQRAWLQQQLAASNDDWKIVIGHHPIYSSGLHGPTPELVNRFRPVLRATNTDFYICGHDHTLQYQSDPGDPVNYLLSGGGSEYTPVFYDNRTRFAAASAGYLVVTLYRNSAHIYFYNQSTRLLYSYVVQK
jgi:tartrate-resistant acid phosphatase type 5